MRPPFGHADDLGEERIDGIKRGTRATRAAVHAEIVTDREPEWQFSH